MTTTHTNSFGINIKINEVEIITLETFCNGSTIVSDLKKIISRERNILNWESIELTCNGNVMKNNDSLAVYDVVCDKHLIYFSIKDDESIEVQIEGENAPIMENKPMSTIVPPTANSTANNNSQLNNNNENSTLENSTLVIVSIFLILAAISQCIGLYAYCTLRDEWNASDISECPDIEDVIDNINLPIGGLSFALATSILFLCFFCCLKCDEKGEMEQGELGCGGCWFISLIMSTVFSSIFLFGNNLDSLETDCGTDVFYDTWNQLKAMCYFSYSWMLLEFATMGLLFLYFFCKMMFE